jgi:hypothetical protein
VQRPRNETILVFIRQPSIAPVGNAVVQRKVESSCSILNIMWLKRMGSAFHVAEQGEGPVVLFCHGFPESWCSWRHQLSALAEAGVRAVDQSQNLMNLPRSIVLEREYASTQSV